MRAHRVAAAVAIAAVSAACTSTGQESRPESQTSSTGTPPAAPERVRLDDLPAGPPPRAAWVDHGDYVAADGSRTAIEDRYGVSAAVPVGDGFLVADTRVFEGSVGLTRYDAAGRAVGSWATSGSPVRSDDERRTAWATYVMPESGESGPTLVHVVGAGGAEPVHRVEGGGQVSVHGFLEGAVVFSRFWGQGVFVTGAGSPAIRVPGVRFARDVDDRRDRVAGQTGTNGGTAVMVDAGSGEVLWRAPGTSLESFSPDGSAVLANTGREGRWVVLDSRSGAARQVVDTPFALWDAVWEDGDHLLAVVVERNRAAVVRVGLDGTVELAAPVVPAELSSPPYTLATG